MDAKMTNPKPQPCDRVRATKLDADLGVTTCYEGRVAKIEKIADHEYVCLGLHEHWTLYLGTHEGWAFEVLQRAAPPEPTVGYTVVLDANGDAWQRDEYHAEWWQVADEGSQPWEKIPQPARVVYTPGQDGAAEHQDGDR